MRRWTFAPTARVFLTEAQGAGSKYASSGLGDLNRLDAFVREVRRHTLIGKRGMAVCRCAGPRGCVLKIREAVEKLREGVAT